MTRDEIISMAREAGFLTAGQDCYLCSDEDILRLVAREREMCAKVCEQSDEDGEGPDCWDWHAKDYAKAIRARADHEVTK